MSVRSRRPPPPDDPSDDDARTGIYAPPERATPTVVERPRVPPRPVQPAPAQIQVISMKAGAAPSEPTRGAGPGDPAPRRVHLRPLSEVRRTDTPPMGLGYLAPPRDPREVRARKLRDLLVWGSVVIVLGSAVMLAVWFLAGS
ncbi:MAG: hypothetical protein ACTHU0_36600 [Kofleriaceae bacterium]